MAVSSQKYTKVLQNSMFKIQNYVSEILAYELGGNENFWALVIFLKIGFSGVLLSWLQVRKQLPYR